MRNRFQTVFRQVSIALGVAGVLVAVALNASAPTNDPNQANTEIKQQVQVAQFGKKPIDTSKPFDHDIHLNPQKVNGKNLSCQDCHRSMVAKDGQCPKTEVRFPPHEACASCHEANFYTPPLTICASCHKSASFSEAPPLKELTRVVTPRKAEFSHFTHLAPNGDAVKKFGQKNDCTSCHSFVKGGVSVSHPSHPNCCECHTKPDVSPKMTECASCHTQGRNVSRPPSKIHDFSHKTHNTDPRTGKGIECRQCHVNGHEATTIGSIQIPPMAVCVQCHNGTVPAAFHFTNCMRCHIPGSIQGVPLPPSHPPVDASQLPPELAPKTPTPAPAPEAPK